MSRRLELFVAAVLILASVVPYLAVHAEAGAVGAASKAVVICIDGARPDHLRELLAEGALPNIAKVVEKGVIAQYSVPVFPTVTAVNTAALATGCLPSTMGITGNVYHRPDPLLPVFLTFALSGFRSDALLHPVEPYWVTAKAAGFETVVISFGVSTPALVNITINGYDVRISWSKLFFHSKVKAYGGGAVKVSITDAVGWTGPVISYSAPLETEIKIVGIDYAKRKYHVVYNVLIVDTTNDGVMNYNMVHVAKEKDVLKAICSLKVGQWSPVIVDAFNVTKGALQFKLVELSADASEFRLYHTRIYDVGMFASVPGIDKEIYELAGPFYGDADGWALQHEWIDEATYMETLEMVGRWWVKTSAFMMDKIEWAKNEKVIMFTYTPIVDNIGHSFHGFITPGNPRYKPELVGKYWGYIRRAYQIADEQVGEILKRIGEETLVAVVSDHGMAPLDKFIYVNKLLKDAGLQVWVDEKVDWKRTAAYYFGFGHVYVNLAGRSEFGPVKLEEYNAVVDKIIAVLKDAKDPDTGLPLFSAVLRTFYLADPVKKTFVTAEAEVLGLYATDFFRSRVGDVIIAVQPGYTPMHHLVDVVVKPAPTYYSGHHAAILPTVSDVHAMFILSGPGVKKLGLDNPIRPVRVIDLVPTLAYLLGTKLPVRVDGTVVWEAVETFASEDVLALKREIEELKDFVATLQESVRVLEGTVDTLVAQISDLLGAAAGYTTAMEELKEALKAQEAVLLQAAVLYAVTLLVVIVITARLIRRKP